MGEVRVHRRRHGGGISESALRSTSSQIDRLFQKFDRQLVAEHAAKLFEQAEAEGFTLHRLEAATQDGAVAEHFFCRGIGDAVFI